jgi:hypothetical protein
LLMTTSMPWKTHRMDVGSVTQFVKDK